MWKSQKYYDELIESHQFDAQNHYIVSCFKELFYSKKKKAMIEKGFFRTVSGDWANNHFVTLSNKRFKTMSLDDILKI